MVRKHKQPHKERWTSQKFLLLEYLQNTKSHPSPETIYQEIKKELPRVSKATIYRNLKDLKERGKIKEIPSYPLRYDGDTSSHAHFICEKCEMIFDIFSKCDLIHRPKTKVGKVNKYQIYLYGICKKCSKQKNLPRLRKKDRNRQ